MDLSRFRSSFLTHLVNCNECSFLVVAVVLSWMQAVCDAAVREAAGAMGKDKLMKRTCTLG